MYVVGAVGTFASKNAAATAQTVTVSGYSIRGASLDNYALTVAPTTAKINAKQLTISGTTADDKNYDGTTAATIHLGTLEGVVGAEVVTVSGTGTFASKDPGVRDVTVVYTLGGADATGQNAGNYLAPVTETIQAEIFGPETPSMHVTTDLDVVDAYDGLISLREALTVYFKTDGTYTIETDGTITYGKDASNLTVTFEDSLTEIKANSTFELTASNNGVVIKGINTDGQENHILFTGNEFSVFTVSGNINATFNNLIFRGNATTGDGAAINASEGTITVGDSEFTGNTSAGDGGAIYFRGDKLTVDRSVFSGNEAAAVGGAIAARDGDVEINYSFLTGNSAESAGALYLSSSSGMLDIYQSLIADNESTNDGGVCLYGGVMAFVKWSTLAGNTNSDGNCDFYAEGIDDSVVYGSILLYADVVNSHLNYDTTLYEFASGADVTEPTNYKLKAGDLLFAGGDDIATKYQLHEHSAAINGTGLTAEEATRLDPTVDLAGNARPYDTYYDFGAYEGGKGPETASMHVTTDLDVVDKWDGLISLREAMTVYYGARDAGEVSYTNDGKTVTFADGLELMQFDEEQGSFLITAAHDGVTIEGERRISFNNETSRIFYMTGAADATFEGVIFRNITASVSGTAFATDTSLAGNGKTVTFDACTFMNNAGAGNGGSVSVYGLDVALTGSTFVENRADYGGAVYVNGGSLTVDGNSSFINNTAAQSGGAIYLVGTDSSLKVNNTVLTLNTATAYGGAVYVDAAGASFTETSFTSNSAEDGGAVHGAHGDLTFVGGTLNRNSATADGGAVYASEDDVTIRGTSFISNTAAQHGGAVYSAKGDMRIDNGSFIYNSATADGGAIYDYGAAHDLKVNGGTFIGNNAGNDGGAVYTDDASAELNGVIFQYNTAVNNGGAFRGNGLVESSTFANNSAKAGGAIYAYTTLAEGQSAGTLTVKNGMFTRNTATSDGGAVYSDVSTGFVLSDSVFTENSAGRDGGAVRGLGIISSSSFTGNSATKGEGGAVYAYNGEISIRDTGFTSNKAKTGGALNADQVTATIRGSNFSLNEASESGGAINLNGSASVITIDGTNFIENKAAANGGAIYNSDASLNVTATSFDKNRAVNGGAVSGKLSARTSVFNANSADENGGAIYGNAELRSSTLTNNTAGVNGGAYYCTETDAAKVGAIDNTTFTLNSAANRGGAISADYLNATASTFTDNHAKYGGAVSGNNATSKFRFTNSNFIMNGATYGGAVSGNDVTTIASSFIGNSADEGGALWAEEAASSFNITGGLFSDNSAAKSGGAIMAGKLRINGTRLRQNTAGEYGGAIARNSDSSDFTIDDARFFDNKAVDGGAVYAEKATVTATVFEQNKATADGSGNGGYGGAIRTTQTGTLTVTESIFGENTAVKGGAIAGHNVTSNQSTFNANTATYGGAILALTEDSTVSVVDSAFNDNSATSWGGAIQAQIVNAGNSKFDGNSAEYGGALCYLSKSGATFTISKSTFSANHADKDGGAIQGSNLDISYSTFEENSAGVMGGEGYGGAIHAADGDTVKLTYTKVLNNTAMTDGGGISLYGVADGISVYQSLIADNGAGRNGGGISVSESGTAQILWSTLANNSAPSGGEDLYVSSNGGAVVSYSILLQAKVDVGTLSYVNSLYQYVADPAGTGFNPDSDCAVYVPGTTLFVGGGNYNLARGSVAINGTGLTSSDVEGPSHDLDDDPRPFEDYYDWGAYEAYIPPETPSMVVTTYDDVVDRWDNLISLREALTVYYKTGGGTTITFADTLYDKDGNNGVQTGVYMNVASTFTLDATRDGVTIDGGTQGKILFDGAHAGAFRLFYLSESANVTFKDLTFQNFNNGARGAVFAAIVAESAEPKTVTFNHTRFEGNTSSDGAGAIRVMNMNLAVTDSQFTNNTGTRGGAIYVVNMVGEVNISGSTFDGNSAGEYGGAAAIRSAVGDVKITGSHFTSNTAKASGGGALYINCAGEDVVVTGSTFADNKAVDSEGGAIFFGTLGSGTASDITVENSEFTGNIADGSGGAVYGNVTAMTGSSFTSNTAAQNGGAYYGSGTAISATSFANNSAAQGGAVFGNGLTISGGIFTENEASDRGGAVISTSATEVLTIKDNSVFKDNKAVVRGGAVLGYKIDVSDSSFEGNRATGGEGGAIYAHSDLNVENSEFTGNTSSTSGGAIYEEEMTALVKITGGSLFDGNTAETYGGAIFAGKLEVTGTESAHVRFVGNTIESLGGAIFLSGETSTITYADFIGNSTTKVGTSSNNMGGAICNYGSTASLTVRNSVFTGNSAGSEFTVDGQGKRGFGGAIRNSEGTLEIYDSVFKQNKGSRGCAVHSFKGTVNVYDTTFAENTGLRGGGLLVNGDGVLSVYHSTFTDNNVVWGGGAILNDAGTVYVEDSEFTGNSSGSVGGAIHAATSNTTEVRTSVFTGNSSAQGGAINVFGGTGKVIGCTVTDNTVTVSSSGNGYGGGIAFRNATSGEVVDSIVCGNSADNYGGGIYGYGSVVTVRQSLVAQNTANYGGGVYFYNDGSDKIEWSTIVDNTDMSGSNGSDLYFSNTNVVVNYSIFGQAYSNYNSAYQTCAFSAVTGTASFLGNYIRLQPGDTLFVGGSDPLEAYKLAAGAVVIDQVTSAPTDAPTTDLAGTTRPQGSAYDMGAYEFDPASPAALPYSDAADAAFAALDDDDLAVDFDAF